MAQNIIHMGPIRREDLFHQIMRALEAMQEPLREVFVRAHYRGEELSTIAAQVGQSEAETLEILKEADRTFRSILVDEK
ncbi:MAG TPA: hypothetical protein VKZ59_13065 [Acidobacteriota bacterium]|nr:hypothetical protein [Acidobacteriota bacterium]